MSLPAAIVIVALSAQAPQSANPSLSALAALPHTTLVRYPVAGRSPNEVRISMSEARPEWGGQRSDATTRWRYLKRWRNDANGVCEPETAEVEVAVTVTLPELIDRRPLRGRRLGEWDAYVSTLAGHEVRRARLALDGANDMRAAMRSATSCAAMRQAADDVEEGVKRASEAMNEALTRGLATGPRYP